ncbi:MAG: hypothetical protein HYX51_08755 [Chloroflexi bacterium]|nr:hypothetical protein [Chloroflexota bacterium]
MAIVAPLATATEEDRNMHGHIHAFQFQPVSNAMRLRYEAARFVIWNSR